MKEEIKITKKDYSKWWTVTQFDVGRKLGHPDYIDSIDRQLESLREAARAVVKARNNYLAQLFVDDYSPQVNLSKADIFHAIDQLAERLEAVDD